MNESTYKKIADKIKKQRGFHALIGLDNEKEQTLFRCCNGNIKKYKELINKALDEWESKKEEWEKENKESSLDYIYYYGDYIGHQIFPFLVIVD